MDWYIIGIWVYVGVMVLLASWVSYNQGIRHGIEAIEEFDKDGALRVLRALRSRFAGKKFP